MVSESVIICKCIIVTFYSPGYTGYDCINRSNATAAISPILSATMLISSNAFFIPAIYLAAKRELYAEALVYLATMLFSSFYHACDQNYKRLCIIKYEVRNLFDLFMFVGTYFKMSREASNYSIISRRFNIAIFSSVFFHFG